MRKSVDIYVHDSEQMWEKATELGFIEGTDAHAMARHAADEFKITLEFDMETGRARVVAIDGREVT